MKPSTLTFACILLAASTAAATEVKPNRSKTIFHSAVKGMKNILMPKKAEPVQVAAPVVVKKRPVQPKLFNDMQEVMERGSLDVQTIVFNKMLEENRLKDIVWETFYPWIKAVVLGMVKNPQLPALNPDLIKASLNLLYKELTKLRKEAKKMREEADEILADESLEAVDKQWAVDEVNCELDEMRHLANDIVTCIEKLDPDFKNESQ